MWLFKSNKIKINNNFLLNLSYKELNDGVRVMFLVLSTHDKLGVFYWVLMCLKVVIEDQV